MLRFPKSIQLIPLILVMAVQEDETIISFVYVRACKDDNCHSYNLDVKELRKLYMYIYRVSGLEVYKNTCLCFST